MISNSLAWEPELYETHGEARLRPARDLIARIPDMSMHRIADLGCGAGAATRLVAERWPSAHIAAIDSSGEMLSATAMRPFLDPLSETERTAFIDACRGPLARAYPPHADGTTLFAMTRLFLIVRAKT